MAKTFNMYFGTTTGSMLSIKEEAGSNGFLINTVNIYDFLNLYKTLDSSLGAPSYYMVQNPEEPVPPLTEEV